MRQPEPKNKRSNNKEMKPMEGVRLALKAINKLG